MNPKVDWYFNKDTQWQKEYQKLRLIILDCELKEELKWGCPCYTYNKKNILLIHGFKEYCAVLFHKGALIKDSENILVQQTENVQSARQLRFTSINEIIEKENIILEYIRKAIEVEKNGLKLDFKNTSEYKIPQELLDKFGEDPKLKEAFYALTPGRQRGYLLHFSGAKQSKTRTDRINRCEDKIYAGKGFNER